MALPPLDADSLPDTPKARSHSGGKGLARALARKDGST